MAQKVRKININLSAARFNEALSSRSAFSKVGPNTALSAPYQPRQLNALNLAFNRRALQNAKTKRNSEAKNFVQQYPRGFGPSWGTVTRILNHGSKQGRVNLAKRAILQAGFGTEIKNWKLDNPSYFTRKAMYDFQLGRLRSPARIQALKDAFKAAHDIYGYSLRDKAYIARMAAWHLGKAAVASLRRR